MTVNSFKQKNMQLDMMVDLNVKSIATFSQGDRISDKLIINVSKDETIEDITGATSVRIDFRKPDGKLVFQNATVEDATKGIVSVILNTQTLSAPGDVQAEVTVNYTGGKSMVTRKFAFHVDEAIAGDTSLASSNDYPMLQKAIDLGDRMTAANVTPAQIVDAGALAANSLPKAGGTMTGPLTMSNSSKITWKNADSTGEVDIAVAADGKMWITDKIANKTIATIGGGVLNVPGETNLVKKAGDTITGPMTFDAAFTVRGSAASWDMRPYASGAYSKGVRHTINTTSNFYAIAPTDVAGAGQWANQVALYGDTGVWDVKDINVRGGSASNVVTKLKDGRTTLTLTADATNVDVTNIPPVTYRRGNNVTLKMAIRRVSATNTILATLPVDMRPIDPLYQTITSTDNTPAIVSIGTNGNVYIGDATGTTPAQNKNYYLVLTYVVD